MLLFQTSLNLNYLLPNRTLLGVQHSKMTFESYLKCISVQISTGKTTTNSNFK